MENTPTESIDTLVQDTQEPLVLSETTSVANEEKKVYNFSLKYWFIEPENRIGRRQFFSRVFVPSIIALICFMFIFPIIVRLAFMLIGGISIFSLMEYTQGIAGVLSLLMTLVLYKMVRITFIKRSHDFGDNGNILQHIVTIGFFGSIVNILISILGGFGVIASGFDLMMLAISGELPWWYMANYYIGTITSIIFFLGFLYLCFRKGNSGVNNFGKDPLLSTKIGFFG